MATIVSSSGVGNPAADDDDLARARLASIAARIAGSSGYDAAAALDLREELRDHLFEAYDRERYNGGAPVDAANVALERFGEPSEVARRIWRTRLVADARASWQLPGLLIAVMLADVIAAVIWIGTDFSVSGRSTAWYVSLLTLFAFVTAVLYWACGALARAGLTALRRFTHNGAPLVEGVLGAGLTASAITAYFMLRPGAVANLIGSKMERVALWNSAWEFAGVVAAGMTVISIIAVVARAKRPAR